MNQNSGEHYHGQHAAKRSPIPMIVAAVVALGLIVALAIGVWSVLKSGGESARPAGSASASKSTSTKSPESDGKTVETVKEHHGNSPDCPDTDCISMLVNGDLLFHEGLWEHFAGANTSATDGTAFNFDPLFEPMKKYIRASDIAVCEFETPIAQRGGPYSAYPIFNIPPEVADAARTSAIRRARTPPTIRGIRVRTASHACGTRWRRTASPRPVRIRPKPIRSNRWSSIRRPAAASSA